MKQSYGCEPAGYGGHALVRHGMLRAKFPLDRLSWLRAIIIDAKNNKSFGDVVGQSRNQRSRSWPGGTGCSLAGVLDKLSEWERPAKRANVLICKDVRVEKDSGTKSDGAQVTILRAAL